MKLGRVALVIATLGAVGIACSTFSSESEDAPVPPQPEGGADGSDFDGPITQPDSSSDAGSDAPFCSTVDAQFCWSFEGADPALLGPLLKVDSNDKSSPVLVDAALSAPNAAELTLGDGGLWQGFRLDVGELVSYLRCDFDVSFDRVESSDAGGGSVSLAQLDHQGSFFNLPYLNVKRTSATTLRASLSFPLVSAPDEDLGNVPVGQWVHAFLDSERIDGKWIAHGGVVQNPPRGLDAGSWTDPHFNRVFFGLSSADKVDWRARMDNLFCNWR